MLTFEDLHHVFHHALVKVLSTKVSVAIGGLHFKHTIVDGQDSDVEGAASKVEYENVLFTSLFVETIGNGCGGRLVDDTLDLEAGDGAGVLGGLTLGVVEVSGDGDDG